MRRNEIEKKPDSLLMTLKDVALECRVSERTVVNWIKRQGLPAVKIQRTVRVERSDLRAFFQTLKSHSDRN